MPSRAVLAEPRPPYLSSNTTTATATATTTTAAAATATATATSATATSAMASPPVLSFDAEGRPIKFETWLDDLHLFLQLTAREDISLYDHALGTVPPPATTAAATARSQWQTRDAHARFAIRNSLPRSRAVLTEPRPPYLSSSTTTATATATTTTAAAATTTPSATSATATLAMASPPVLSFDAEGRPIKFETWLDDLHLFLQLTAREDISLYDHALGTVPPPSTTAAATARSQWQTRDAHARFAIRNSLPVDEREHFGQHQTAQALTLPFCAWGSRAFVRDTSADKLSSRTAPCVFLGFVPDASGWQFYHPASHRVFPSQDVTFDESVPFYRLFPYRTAPLPPLPLFLAPGAAVVDPLPPQGAAPSGVSQVDPVEPAEVAVDSRPARGAEPERAEPERAEPGGAESGGAETGGAEPGGAETWGAEPGGAESGGTEPGVAESGGTEPGGVAADSEAPGGPPSSQQLREWYSRYCSLRRGASRARGATGAGTRVSPPRREPPSSPQLREWYARHISLRSGAAGAGVPGVGAAAGAGGTTATGGAAGGAASTEDPGVGAAAGVADPAAGGTTSAAGGAAAAAGVEYPEVGASAGAEDPVAGVSAGSGVAARPRLYFVPLLQQVLGQPPPPCSPLALECPPSVQSQPQLPPASPLPVPSPYTGPTGGLAERREPASRPVPPASRRASPDRAATTGRRVQRQRPPAVPGTHQMALRQSTAPQRVALPSPPASSLPAFADPESDTLRAASPTVTRLLGTVVTDPSFESAAASALVAELVDFAAACRLDYAASLVAKSESVCPPSVGGECALGTDVLEDRQEEFGCLAAALPHLVSMLVAPEGDPDAPDIPTPRSYAEAMAGPYSSPWQTAMDTEMAS
ncbi:unnamed protein product [Closterium sp. NIES-54]